MNCWAQFDWSIRARDACNLPVNMRDAYLIRNSIVRNPGALSVNVYLKCSKLLDGSQLYKDHRV